MSDECKYLLTSGVTKLVKIDKARVSLAFFLNTSIKIVYWSARADVKLPYIAFSCALCISTPFTMGRYVSIWELFKVTCICNFYMYASIQCVSLLSSQFVVYLYSTCISKDRIRNDQRVNFLILSVPDKVVYWNVSEMIHSQWIVLVGLLCCAHCYGKYKLLYSYSKTYWFFMFQICL